MFESYHTLPSSSIKIQEINYMEKCPAILAPQIDLKHVYFSKYIISIKTNFKLSRLRYNYMLIKTSSPNLKMSDFNRMALRVLIRNTQRRCVRTIGFFS